MVFKDRHKMNPLIIEEAYEDGDYVVNFISEDWMFNNPNFKKMCDLCPTFMSTTINYINKHKEINKTLDCIIVDKFFSLVNRSNQDDKAKVSDSRTVISMMANFLIKDELQIKKIHVNPSGSGLNQAQLVELFKSLLTSIKKINRISVIVYV